jgi:four helix bundle protein
MENDEGFRFQKLDAYKVAKEIAVRVHEARIRDAELRDQATRAAKSAFLGLCEGLPNEMPGLRRRYFTQSRNSVCELAGAVDLSAAIGAMDESQAKAVLALALRLKRMLRARRGGPRCARSRGRRPRRNRRGGPRFRPQPRPRPLRHGRWRRNGPCRRALPGQRPRRC